MTFTFDENQLEVIKSLKEMEDANFFKTFAKWIYKIKKECFCTIHFSRLSDKDRSDYNLGS